MVTYDYTDIDTGEAEDDPMAGTYSVVELLHEHRVRYVMRTSNGSIILRHMPLRMRHMIEAVKRQLHPNYAELAATARDLAEGLVGLSDDEIPQEHLDALLEINAQLALWQMDALGVVVSPALTTMDDYDALYESLDPIDRARLTSAICTLSAPLPESRVDGTALDIAKSLGLDILDPDMPEMLTVSQAAWLESRITRENRAIERMLSAGRTRKVG